MEFHDRMLGRHMSRSMSAFHTERACFVILSVSKFSLNGVIRGTL